MSNNKSTDKAAKEIFEYVKRNKNRLPDYWQDKGTNVCIMGMCAMIARDKYTSKEIADFYECPIALVDEVRYAYKKTIRNLRAEHRSMEELRAELYPDADLQKCGNDECGFIELMRRIFER